MDCICCRQASIYLICVWGPCSGQSASVVYSYLIFTVIIIAIFQMRKLKIRKVFRFKFTQLKRISGCQFTYSLEASKLSTTACLLLFASFHWLLMTHSAKSKLLKETLTLSWPGLCLYFVPPLSPHPLETNTLHTATGGSAIFLTFQAVSGLLAIDHIFPLPKNLSLHQTYLTDN